MRTLADSMTDAFGVMEQRMIHPQTGLPLNYTGLDGCVSLPTEEDLREGRPSHLGWNSPMEDGAFYGGLYLDGLCNRARFSDDARALTAATRTARGLAALSALGADGFVARGFVGASRSHFRCGSQDQTFPWLYGLWRFIRSGIDSQGAAICRDAVLRVCRALSARDFRIPSDPPSFGDRGDLTGAGKADICKLLFLLKALFTLTGDVRWETAYQHRLMEKPTGQSRTRLQRLIENPHLPEYDGHSVFYCLEDGAEMEAVFGRRLPITTLPLFTLSMANLALRGLAEMEDEPELRTLYTRILARDAQAAWTHVGRYRGYQETSAPPFRDDWRAMNALWEEQKCVADAHRIAWAQMPIWFSHCPRFPYENAYVREPLHAALIYALGLPWLGDTRGLGQVLTMLTVLPWDRLYTATFLTALTVYGQLAADECQPI